MAVTFKWKSNLAGKTFKPCWTKREKLEGRNMAKVETYLDLDTGVLYIVPVEDKEICYCAEVSE